MLISLGFLLVIVLICVSGGALLGMFILIGTADKRVDPRNEPGHCGTCGGLLDFGLSEEDKEDEENA
jgi:hypothetical protein